MMNVNENQGTERPERSEPPVCLELATIVSSRYSNKSERVRVASRIGATLAYTVCGRFADCNCSVINIFMKQFFFSECTVQYSDLVSIGQTQTIHQIKFSSPCCCVFIGILHLNPPLAAVRAFPRVGRGNVISRSDPPSRINLSCPSAICGGQLSNTVQKRRAIYRRGYDRAKYGTFEGCCGLPCVQTLGR
jgi:hypothetical protein